jgi:hypothetical protein
MAGRTAIEHSPRLALAIRPAVLLSVFFASAVAMPGPGRGASNQPAAAPTIDELQRAFESPPDNSRIMMRWWWFGPAVTKPELEREMRMMKAGGIGGFEVQPVYPLALEDSASGIRNLPFLSDEFIEVLRFTAEKARELGLRMDLTLGSGWPFGGPQVPIRDAAGKLRCVRVKVAPNSPRIAVPDLGAGEEFLAVYLAHTNGQAIFADSVREITDIRDGVVRLPEGLDRPAEVLFFISSFTGMQVKRAAVGAEGFVLNHYDRLAVEHYLKNVGDRLMQAFGDNPPYSVFCDSLEVYESDWTGDLLEQFRNRRGYDLKPYLPALVADIGPNTAAIRHDWGKTLTELFNERFAIPVREWAQAHHTLFRMQGYGIPPASVSSNSLADLPEGEGPQWKILRASRWASSASHLYGRPVTSSETWTWLHSPIFRATPLDVKAEADLHFLQGINQLVGHGWPYTPEGIAYPGWRFYAAGAFNEKNPWWIVMPDLELYLQRISFLMRQGRPANDIALYLPNSDAWARFSAGRVNMIDTLRELVGPDIVARVLEAGYDFDFFDDDALKRDALKQIGRVENGRLALGENKYKIVILPAVERIPLETLRRLEEFARAGGILIATRRIPDSAAGLLAIETEQSQIRQLSHRLFEGSPAPAHFVADENQLASKLKSLLRPDVSLSPSVPEIGFIHRTANNAEIYFLANTSNKPQRVKATFRVGQLRPEWWDPITGAVSPAEGWAGPEGTTVSLDLEPYGSRVLVFTGRELPHSISHVASVIPPAMDISTDWRVSFGPNGPPVKLERLRSWTEDDATRYFSGLATYEKQVVVPASMLQDGLAVRLDFGEGKPEQPVPLRSGMQAWLDSPVAEAAVVYINGQKAGSIWCPPYSVDVTGYLRPGENTLRIIVGNLAINHMAGRALPDYRLLNLRYGERFQPQDMDKVQPVPAGLLGPIRLIVTSRSERPAVHTLRTHSPHPNRSHIAGDANGH